MDNRLFVPTILGVEKVIFGGGYIDFYPIISLNVGFSHYFSTPFTIAPSQNY